MQILFLILCVLTLASAIAAMSLRNLVHCALCLMITFAGLASLYLQMHAQFIGLVQLLVYVGAVGILIIFAILLTRGTDQPAGGRFSRSWVLSLGSAMLLFGSLVIGAHLSLPRTTTPAGRASHSITVKEVGERLMSDYVLPLEILGLLLTAAMLGAVILAMKDPAREETRS